MNSLLTQINAAQEAGPHAKPFAAEKVAKSFEAALKPMAQKLAAEQGVKLDQSVGRGK